MFDRVLDKPLEAAPLTERRGFLTAEGFEHEKVADKEAREYVSAVCKKIRELAQKSVENYIEIGFALADLKTRANFDSYFSRQLWNAKGSCTSYDFYNFVEVQFGFKKAMTNFLIQVAQKFGERGCVLSEKYRKFTWSQLREMVSCSDDLLEKITPEMTVREIRALKKSFGATCSQDLPADSPAEDTSPIEEQAFSFGGVEYFLSKMGKPDIINLLLQVDRQRQIFEQLLQMYKERFKVTLKLPKKKGEPEEFDGSIAAVS